MSKKNLIPKKFGIRLGPGQMIGVKKEFWKSLIFYEIFFGNETEIGPPGPLIAPGFGQFPWNPWWPFPSSKIDIPEIIPMSSTIFFESKSTSTSAKPIQWRTSQLSAFFFTSPGPLLWGSVSEISPIREYIAPLIEIVVIQVVPQTQMGLSRSLWPCLHVGNTAAAI